MKILAGPGSVCVVFPLGSVKHTLQYMIVHGDTSDLHQYSEIVSATTQCTLPSGQPTHTDPGPTKLFTDTACD